jgi:hypothetical protein
MAIGLFEHSEHGILSHNFLFAPNNTPTPCAPVIALEQCTRPKDTHAYVAEGTDEQPSFSSDVEMREECDVVMVDSDLSEVTTQPAPSHRSVSSLPAEDGPQHAGDCVAFMCLHAEAVECGGLNMAELKEAMVKESAAQEPLVSIIGILLDKTVARNDDRKRASNLRDFESHLKCSLTASAYLSRMIRYGACSPSCAVVGLVYLQRLKTKEPTACVTSHNLQRLVLVAVMLANKYLDDLYYSNKHWAKIGGITVQELNHLEATALHLLDWKMHVTREEYLEYLEGLGCGPQCSVADTDTWAKELKQLQEMLERGELSAPAAVEPSPTVVTSPMPVTEISVTGCKFGHSSMEERAPAGPAFISRVTSQPTKACVLYQQKALASSDPFAGVWDEQGGYTRYSAQEKSRVAEMREMIEVLEREKETLQHTAGDCGSGVGKADRQVEEKKHLQLPILHVREMCKADR